VDLEAIACVHSFQYSSVQYSTVCMTVRLCASTTTHAANVCYCKF